MVGVERSAEIRRLYFVKRLSIKEIVQRIGHGRNTIRRALRSPEPSALDWAAIAVEEHGRELAQGFVDAAKRGDWRAAEALLNRI